MKKYLMLMFLSVLSVSSVKSAPAPYVSSGVQTNYMKDDMQFLASSCPFVEGTAVYRARTIYCFWEPNAIFDDRIICIQGQNKNQDNTNINIDSLIESQITEANIKAVGGNLNISGKSISIAKKVDVNAIEVYPNPASSVVIISYNSEVDGYFKLYNSFGEVVLATILSKDITKTQLQIKDVANGLYHYEVEFPNIRKTIGKLTIIK